MKNILFLNIGLGGEAISYEVAFELQKRLHADKIYAVKVEEYDSRVIKRFSEIYDFSDVINGKYNNDYLTMTPLDAKLVNSNIYTQVLAMSLMRRMGGNIDYDTRQDSYYKHLLFWSNFLSSNCIDLVVFAHVPHEIYDNVVLGLCRNRKIRTVMMYLHAITSKNISSYWMEDYTIQNDEIYNIYNKYRDLYAENQEEDIIFSKDETYIRFNELKQTSQIDARVNYHISKRQDDVKHHYYISLKNLINILPRQRIIDKILWPFRIVWDLFFARTRYYKELLETNNLIWYYNKNASSVEYDSKYIFFPLHYQPECSSQPLGGVYENQILVAKMLSYYAPDDCKIYIKEHPMQSSFGRKSSMYDELLKIPKVILVNSNESSFKLMKNAYAVASITGTAGWEAQFYGVPFLMFGYTIYRYAPGTIEIHTNEDCERAFVELEHGRGKATIKDLKCFMKAVEEKSYDLECVTTSEIVDRIMEILV